MDPIVKEIRSILGENNDFFLQRDIVADSAVVLLCLDTLVDMQKTRVVLQKLTHGLLSQGTSTQDIWNVIGERKEGSSHKVISAIKEGKLVINIEGTNRCILFEPVSKMLNRSIDVSTNENVIKGALNSFNENIEINIGLLRKQIVSSQLTVNTFSIGNDIPKSLAILYINGKVDTKIVEKVKSLIEKNKKMDISNIQGLSKMFEFSTWDTISKFNSTELPYNASQSLKRGRVVLFIDQLPFAIILPNLLWDMFIVENDRNLPQPLMIALRCLRVIGMLIALISPGLYVALVAVNPEVLQIEIALSVLQSREGVPYPAIVEVLIMLVILELILEAIVRLPKSIGPAITMVGGIILGQAIVEAKLVSNLLIIILAATTIGNSTLIGAQNFTSIRIYKYLNVILASIFGVFGLVTGFVIICAHMASINTFGKSYLHINTGRSEY